MKKISRSLLLILSVLFVVCCIGLATARESIKLADKIAFLKDGDVWVADRDGRNMKRLTDTKEKIYKFLFSPDLGHLAFSRIVKYVDETGSKGEENVLQQAVLSTTIMSIKSGKILKEVLPPETSWIYPARWLPEGRLLFYLASGFDVAGFFEYDIGKMEQRDLDYRKGDQLAEADFHYGGSLMAYVEHDVTGESTVVQLHLIDLQTNRDRIVTSRKSILEPRISHDKNRIAFLEVEEDGEGRSFDRLWIYDIRKGSCIEDTGTRNAEI